MSKRTHPDAKNSASTVTDSNSLPPSNTMNQSNSATDGILKDCSKSHYTEPKIADLQTPQHSVFDAVSSGSAGNLSFTASRGRDSGQVLTEAPLQLFNSHPPLLFPAKEGKTGTIVYDNGGEYDGEYKKIKGNSIRHGKGVHILRAEKYEGSWECDNQAGFGILTLSDGLKLKGFWKDNKLEGHAVCSYSNGTSYGVISKNGAENAPQKLIPNGSEHGDEFTPFLTAATKAEAAANKARKIKSEVLFSAIQSCCWSGEIELLKTLFERNFSDKSDKELIDELFSDSLHSANANDLDSVPKKIAPHFYLTNSYALSTNPENDCIQFITEQNYRVLAENRLFCAKFLFETFPHLHRLKTETNFGQETFSEIIERKHATVNAAKPETEIPSSTSKSTNGSSRTKSEPKKSAEEEVEKKFNCDLYRVFHESLQPPNGELYKLFLRNESILRNCDPIKLWMEENDDSPPELIDSETPPSQPTGSEVKGPHFHQKTRFSSRKNRV